MEKKKCIGFVLFLILCYSLFQPSVRAQPSLSVGISSHGNIVYQTQSQENLAVIPDDWLGWGGVNYYSNVHLDYDVVRTAEVPSIRIERHVEGDDNTARECDGTWYPVQPGDHILARCWMKTEPSQLGDTNPYSGARIGIDLYNMESGHGSYLLWGIEESTYYNPHNTEDERDNYVHWGTSEWTLRTIEFDVPDVGFTYNYMPGQEGTIPATKVSHIVLWLQVWSGYSGPNDPARAWFADAEFYINPK